MVLGAQGERRTITANVNECLSTTESTRGAEGKGLDGLPTTNVVKTNSGRPALLLLYPAPSPSHVSARRYERGRLDAVSRSGPIRKPE